MWQVAGGHGQIDPELAVKDMMRYHDAGFTSWDRADIYGPAEDFIGQFRRNLLTLKGKEELDRIQVLTNWVPQPRRITHVLSMKIWINHFSEWMLARQICINSIGGIIAIRIWWMLSLSILTDRIKE